MASRNPYGSPPRVPGRDSSRGVSWYGERWFIADACERVGIHPNTFTRRRRLNPDITVNQALGVSARSRPPSPLKGARIPNPRELHAMINELRERLDRIESGAIVLVNPRAA